MLTGRDVVGRAHDAVGPGRNGGAGQHHEVGRAARHVQRIVRLQRDEHGAAAALVDEIETVIEELAEQREPRVERGRQADVRRDVGDHGRCRRPWSMPNGSSSAHTRAASDQVQRASPTLRRPRRQAPPVRQHYREGWNRRRR